MSDLRRCIVSDTKRVSRHRDKAAGVPTKDSTTRTALCSRVKSTILRGSRESNRVIVVRRRFGRLIIAATAGLLGVTLGATAGFYGILPTLAASATIALFALTIAKPDLGIIAWLGTTIFVPEWTRIYGFEPTSFAGVPVVTGLIVASIFQRRRLTAHLSWADVTLSVGVSIILVQFALEIVPGFAAKDAVLVWALAYFIGRQSTLVTQNAFVILMVITALWGISEFTLGMHVFESWSVGDWHNWNRIQMRAELPRSEAAMGHAIAYGASLALAIPFAHRMRCGPAIQVILCSGIVVSLSRGPLLAMVITLILMAIFLTYGEKRTRSLIPLFAGSCAGIVVIIVLYLNPTSSSKVESSSLARITQLQDHIVSLQWLTSSLTPGAYGVIDSTPLRLAVNFGILTALLLFSPALLAIFNLVTSRNTPASVALAGQLCVLAVTSLIVQWPALIFFTMGAVVTERRIRSHKMTET